MDGLFLDVLRPINLNFVMDPEPDPAAFLHRYGRHVRRVPMVASRLDGSLLRTGLSRMKPRALGSDGRSLAHLRSVPDKLLGWLAHLLREVELLGNGRPAWPRATQA